MEPQNMFQPLVLSKVKNLLRTSHLLFYIGLRSLKYREFWQNECHAQNSTTTRRLRMIHTSFRSEIYTLVLQILILSILDLIFWSKFDPYLAQFCPKTSSETRKRGQFLTKRPGRECSILKFAILMCIFPFEMRYGSSPDDKPLSSFRHGTYLAKIPYT